MLPFTNLNYDHESNGRNVYRVMPYPDVADGAGDLGVDDDLEAQEWNGREPDHSADLLTPER